MLKAVIFDVDDTLLDWSGVTRSWPESERPHLDGVVRYIQTIYPALSAEMFIHEYSTRVQSAWASARSSLLAPHLGAILMDTAIKLGVPDDALETQALLAAYAWQPASGIQVFPDVIQALSLLRDNGIQLGLVTNSFHPSALRDIELEALGLLDFFPKCRLTAADVGVLKPHSTIFLKALERLGVAADEAIYVGDNPVADVAGAQGAGLRAVLRVKSPAPPLISGLIVPDAAVNTLHELMPVLDDWFTGWRSA